MERLTLNADTREDTGKGAARSLRRAGRVPAVIYRDNKSTSLTLDCKELKQFIRATSGDQVLVNLNLPEGQRLVLLKEFQVDPVAGDLLHADFFEVSMKEMIRVTVHLTTTGEPIGVKRDKGILQIVTRVVEVECLPGNIPGHIDVDVSELEIGKSVSLKDIEIPKNVTLLTDTREVIASVIAPKVEEEPVEEEAEEAVEGEEGEEKPEADGEDKKEDGEKKESD